MRTLIAAVLCAAGVAVAAQKSPSTSARQTTSPDDRSIPVTVTGCLTAAADQHTFTLTTAPRASVPSADTSGATPTPTGTSGSATSQSHPTTVPTITYTLLPQGSVDLKSHVGHTVEVSGNEPPQKQSVATSTDRRSTDAKATGRSGAEEAKVETTATAAIVARQLTVASVRDLAANCQVAK